MSRRRWLGLAVAGVTAASVLTAGATALAASAGPVTHGNNRQASARVASPSRASHPAATAHRAGTVTHHYALAASAFAPDSLNNTADDYYNSWDPASLRDSTSGRCFNAGISLPANATMKAISFYYTEGSDSMYVELNRQNLLHHQDAEIVHFDTASTTGTPFYTHTAKNISSDGTVNYSAYAYGLGVCPDGSTTFSGAIITYTQPK